MVELKVKVDGVQRIVCGVNEATKCQDIVLVLAQATGQIGRFNLVEKCQDFERSLRPQENPLLVMSKWGSNSRDTYFLLRKTGNTPGNTPGNSRPPSVTKELCSRFKEVNSPTESVEGFSQQRRSSLRRSQTFNGYRGRTPRENDHQTKDSEDSTKDKARYQALSELVYLQQERLARQHQDLKDIEDIIQSLVDYESLESQWTDSDSGIEEFKLRSKRNKAQLRELEFWETELEIEEQLQKTLKQKTQDLQDCLQKREEEFLLRQQEIATLTEEVEKYREKLQQERDEAAVTDLAEIREEIRLLEKEFEDYSKSTQEIEQVVEQLNRTLKEKKSQETKLKEDLAQENRREIIKISQSSSTETNWASHNTQSLSRVARPRADSAPTETYATFPFRRLVMARPAAGPDSPDGNPEGIFV